MFLQLCEPGYTPLSEQTELQPWAVGIDLGTTNSLIAFSQAGRPVVLKEKGDTGLLPSVVAYPANDTVVVGEQALAYLDAEPSNVIVSVKCFMGQGDAQNQSRIIRFDTAHGPKTPVEVSADILRALKQKAERVLPGQKIRHAVITVPAYFDDAARTATRDAARLAGIEVLRLVNEPTAAALAYGLDKGVEGLYAVYDLGGGTFDFSLLRLQKGVFQVLATGGNTRLGGDDFDRILLEHMTHRAGVKLTPQSPGYKRALQQARRFKERLSSEDHITDCFDIEGRTYAFSVTVEDYRQLIQPIIQQTLTLSRHVLHDAGIEPEALQGIVMVGGATRTPAVVEAVHHCFGHRPLCDIHPDEAVALGAALQAESLTVGSDNLLLDVNPLSLGIETMGGLVERIIPRNSPIPLSRTQEFTTFQDGQTAMLIHVVQGERELVQDCRSLARFDIRGIPPLPAGIARIQVTFTVDADGLLTVTATEKTTGLSQYVEVKPTYGLSATELHQMLISAFENAEEDMSMRLLHEARVKGQQLINTLTTALAKDAALLTPGERQDIQHHIQHLQQVQSGTNHQAIQEAIKALETATQHFAEKRIERAIDQALQGQSLSHVGQSLSHLERGVDLEKEERILSKSDGLKKVSLEYK